MTRGTGCCTVVAARHILYKGEKYLKCVSCEKEEAKTLWDSLAFQRRIGVSTLSEWATGWIGFGLLGAAIVLYWVGWLLLRRFATKAEGHRDALLLGKVEKDGKMFVPLGEGLYDSKKEFLAVNSLMGSNEEKVYNEFIATGKWREMVEKPELFRFLSL